MNFWRGKYLFVIYFSQVWNIAWLIYAFFLFVSLIVYLYCLLFGRNKSTLLEFHHDVAIFTTFFLTKYMYLFLKDWGRNSWGFLSVRLWCQLRAWEKNLKESVKDIFIACYSLCEIRFHWSECDKTLRPSVVESSRWGLNRLLQ